MKPAGLLLPAGRTSRIFLIGYVGVILLTEMGAEYFYQVRLHISPFQKFIGIVVIMLLSLLYSRSAAIRKACKPVFNIVMVPIGIYDKLAGALIGALLWPFKTLFRTLRQSPNT